jgi:hypothetical protein
VRVQRRLDTKAGRGPASAATATVMPRRVLLTGDELDLLRRLAGDLRLPPDFRMEPWPKQASGQASGQVGDRSRAGLDGGGTANRVRLRERGLIQTGSAAPDDTRVDTIHPSMRANLAVFASREMLVETRVQAEADGRPRMIRAAHAVAGLLGASLVRVDEVAVAALSIFPAEALGAELGRVVPSVGRTEHSGERSCGLLPLAALSQLGVIGQAGPERAGPRAGPDRVAEIVGGPRLDAAELSCARAVLAQVRGVLQSTVLVLPRAAAEPARFGQVLWYATAGDWIGVAPEPGIGGEASVRLSPADPADLCEWLSPLVGEAIQ